MTIIYENIELVLKENGTQLNREASHRYRRKNTTNYQHKLLMLISKCPKLQAPRPMSSKINFVVVY